MPLNPAPTSVIVRREHKEGKLHEFLTTHLSRISNDGGSISDISRGWTVIARSPASPILKVLHEIGRAHGPLNVLLALAMSEDAEAAPLALDSFAREWRLLTDPRHLHAHEQLILDGATCWIGDCMRREPAKRDAYEQYVTDCPQTTAWAASAFRRFWNNATPSAITPSEAVQADEEALMASLAQNEVSPTAVVGTRH